MVPAVVNIRNAVVARKNLEKRALSQRKKSRAHIYSVGDHVRISRLKGTFDKGYEKNYSEEIFKITRVSRRQNLFTYELTDLEGEIIDGFCYLEELARVGDDRLSQNKEFKVERVIKSRGRGVKKQVFVKWLGYPDK
ncbi:uncharacterized protein LOC116416572 [Nasonia vitripennis]|uniref:Chromo domain-containing protein n=1 Tax=Nasonia vitripennis TaxID=7425 RepID=A0A7M7Q806_NASVI|nr:uncharacterized protein LOC116416572 [Nasonia vitripennis]